MGHVATDEALEPGPGPGSGFLVFGWLMILAGVGAAIGAFYFDVGVSSGSFGAYGVPERVANMDRVAIRAMILAGGQALFVAGWISVAAGAILGAIKR